jgi:hypothetical protein
LGKNRDIFIRLECVLKLDQDFEAKSPSHGTQIDSLFNSFENQHELGISHLQRFRQDDLITQGLLGSFELSGKPG